MSANVSVAVAVAVAYLAISLVSVACAVLCLIGEWKLFTKAGKPGWASLIPFYNTYVLFSITWKQPLLFLLVFVPVANLVIMIMTYIKLAKAFGKSNGFAVGMILLPFVFFLKAGLDDSVYLGIPE